MSCGASSVGARTESVMTRNNAKKLAARARQSAHDGKYQAHLRQVGGATGESASSATPMKYVHVHYGTSQGTVWLLSDESEGAVLRLAVPALELTREQAEEAFARAAFPLVTETSSDGGKTWIQHLDVEPQRDWALARRLIYGLLGSGDGQWSAGRIRARTGEELLRHPPKLLAEVAEQIGRTKPKARVTLQAPNDQLLVRINRRIFAMATSMKRATTWPVYVTPVPPPNEHAGSWACVSIEDVLATLDWPQVQPAVRIASVEEVRAGVVTEPIRGYNNKRHTVTDREKAAEEAAVGRLLHDDSEADEDGFIHGAGFDRYGGFPGDGLS